MLTVVLGYCGPYERATKGTATSVCHRKVSILKGYSHVTKFSRFTHAIFHLQCSFAAPFYSHVARPLSNVLQGDVIHRGLWEISNMADNINEKILSVIIVSLSHITRRSREKKKQMWVRE